MLKWCMRLTVLLLMLLAWTGCGNKQPAPSDDLSSQEQVQNPQESAIAPEEEQVALDDQNLPYEEWLKQVISNIIGATSNIDKPRVDSILFFDENESDMEIILWADTSFTHSMVRDGIILHSTDVLRRVFSDPRAERVSLYWLLPAKDSYGDETETMAARVVLTRDTADKINWKGLSPLGLPRVADKFDFHPKLQQ
ncbi:MAG TPA: hypothetical protein PK822_08170 [Bacillota bacterium]|nr:hypothetical protein [Bacillota bacterium]